jgi:hypothetical protein
MKTVSEMTGGTVQTPNYHECGWPAYVRDDVSLQTRLFTYMTAGGIVAGGIWNVMFTIDRPARDVWPHFKDWNRWMNSYGFYWPGVVGDRYRREERDFEKGTFPLTVKKPNHLPEEARHYQLLRVLPEHLIVLYEPVPEDGSTGGVCPGIHIFMLNERSGKTIVTITLEHATRSQHGSQAEAIVPWRDGSREVQRFWLEVFIPNLKRLVYESK